MSRARHNPPVMFRFRQSGASAAEFAIILPVFILTIFGTIGLSTMMYMIAALHFTVEDAARCASVKILTCSNPATTSAYALGKYSGPALSDLTFTLTPASSAQPCGNKVTGTGAFVLRTGLANLSVPVSATACYPAR